MSLVLVSSNGDRRFRLADGSPMVVGRELTCDVPILDSSVSRRHAEIRADGHGMAVVDLGSHNGTWINGTRVQHGRAAIGDTIAFGGLGFDVQADVVMSVPTEMPSAKQVVVERPVPARDEAITEVVGARFAKLIGLAQRLGGLTSVDQLLPIIVDDLFGAFDADRVAIVLRNAHGQLETRLARDAYGGDAQRSVPRTIIDGVAERQTALLTHDALSDILTAGESVMRQAVRSAMAAPLLGEGHRIQGVVYVDNVRNARAFSDHDLHFLIAFAGIAAAAVEREETASRLRAAAHIRENFERYFTPQLADRIASTTESLALGGERKTLVVLFSDVRGFTAIAESLPPIELATQLNEYFTAMVDCVFMHEGALDKFIGDAVLAYWGAPESHIDDANRAVLAAHAMQRSLADLNNRWRAEGRPELHVGIGMHSGDAFVGNIGSPRRLEYTLIGDTVNLTKRLSDMAHADEILVSDAVRARLSIAEAKFEARPMLTPKGRVTTGIDVWAVTA